MRTKNRLPAGPDNPADVVVMEEQNLKGNVLIFSGSLHEKNVFAAWALQLEESDHKAKPIVKEASLAGITKVTESK